VDDQDLPELCAEEPHNEACKPKLIQIRAEVEGNEEENCEKPCYVGPFGGCLCPQVCNLKSYFPISMS